MKKKLLRMMFMGVAFLPFILYAQPFSLQQFRTSDPKEFISDDGSFTLIIKDIPVGDSIIVTFESDPDHPLIGERASTQRGYKLDEFLADLEPGDKAKFNIIDAKTNTTIQSFTVVRGGVDNGGGGDGGGGNGAGANMTIAFYDAQSLYKKYADAKTWDQEILARYHLTEADIKKNDFFLAFLKIDTKVIQDNKVVSHSFLGGALARLSGIDVTKYVQATADLLRDRIKEELALAFIDRFKKAIESYPELKALLPKSYQIFITADPFKVPTLGQAYKAAFQDDLENFVENFEKLVDTDDRYAALRRNQVFTAFRVAYHTIDMSANDFHPIDIFEYLDARYGLNTNLNRDQDINKYISLLNLLSQHLRKKQAAGIPQEGWVNIEDLKKFNPNAILLFWGLVYHQNPGVFDKIEINSISLKNHILKGSATLQVYLKQFVVLANNIDQRIREFKEIIKNIRDKAEELKEVAIKDFLANADKLVEVTDFIFQLPYFNTDMADTYYKSAYYVSWRPVIFDVIETTKAIYAKNYGKIAVNAVSVVRHLSGVEPKVVFSEEFIKNLTFYYNFIVDVTNADSADNVKAVLERYAQPVGSYRVKRKSKFSVSLNAYPGIYYGVETYKGEKASVFGVTAPIGLSFNRGSWGKQNDWSWSIFINAVDIAAALSYRFSNDSLDLPEKVTLGQIFAPGAYFILGFPRVPISAKLGAQYVPRLREITKDGNTLGDVGVWRFGLSATVDIPIFNFYNRSKVK